MSRIITNPVVNVSACIRLTKQELSALDAISGYGTDEFLKVFYDRMGEAYLKPHEAGLRTLFATIRTEVPAILVRAEASRKVFDSSPSSLSTAPRGKMPSRETELAQFCLWATLESQKREGDHAARLDRIFHAGYALYAKYDLDGTQERNRNSDTEGNARG